jgi:small-conductance mechanosensitive channel
MNLQELIDYWPFMIVLGSLVLGIFFQVIFARYFKTLAEKTKWQWDDMLMESIGRFPLYLCVLAGCYFSLNFALALEPTYKDTIRDLLGTLIVIAVTVMVARIVSGSVASVTGSSKGKVATTTLIANGSKLLVYLVGLIIIMQNLDIQITPIVTALGLGGLAVALALEDTLNNLFCGVQIVVSRFVRVGDYVKLETGHEGYITDIKARNTTIRSFPDRNRIIVPNSKMASSIVINYSLPERNLWVIITAGVAYDSDLEKVEKVTLEVAREVVEAVEGGLSEQEPVFLYDEFADSSINFTLRVFVNRFRDQFKIKHEFIKRLHKRYEKENIEIPFPIRTIHMKPTESDHPS